MDELPRSAKALIARARAAEQPPEGAEERVRAAVAVAISVGAGTAAATAASHASASTAASLGKAGWFAGSAIKLAVVGGVVATLGTTAVWMRSNAVTGARPATPAAITRSASAATHPQHTRAQAAAPAEAPATQEVPVQEQPPSAAASQAEAPRSPVAHAPHAKHTAPEPASSLHEEMTLLYEASAALDRGDLRTARTLLHSHVLRYEHGQLVPERLGLQVLEACLSHRPSAAVGAKAYLHVSPDAVLATRVASACKLEREEP